MATTRRILRILHSGQQSRCASQPVRHLQCESKGLLVPTTSLARTAVTASWPRALQTWFTLEVVQTPCTVAGALTRSTWDEARVAETARSRMAMMAQTASTGSKALTVSTAGAEAT